MKRIFTRLLLVLLCTGLFASESMAIVPPSSVPVSVEPDPATVKAAVAEFHSLPRKERKARIREARKALKAYVASERAAGRAPKADLIVQVICAILIPPLGVYLHEGQINTRFWISLVLTLLFFIPGMIYSLIVVLGG